MLATTVAGLNLDCCVYNASGPRTGSVDALQKVGNSKSGAILSKSATLVAQDGNDLPRFLNKIDLGPVCEGSVNSEGLPNYGIDYYLSAEAISSLTVFGKPYIISLSGLSLRDNLEMLTRAYATDGVAAIELNLACPNIPGKPTIAYDFQQMEDVLAAVTSHPSFGKKPLGVKLAPYMDFPHMDHAATLIAKHPGIKFVVTINTIGNALFVDTENECEGFKAKGGMGGLGGGYVKHTALANVRQLSLLLAKKGRADIDVVGVGGVSTGRDAFEMILCGAKAVQVGTRHWTEGPSCFKRIAGELEDIMRAKGYKSIEDFRGKLKPYVKHTSTYGRKMASERHDQDAGALTKRPTGDMMQYVAAALAAVVAFLLADKFGLVATFP